MKQEVTHAANEVFPHSWVTLVLIGNIAGYERMKRFLIVSFWGTERDCAMPFQRTLGRTTNSQM